MIKNMGTADRVIRVLVAIGIVVALVTGRVSGVLGIVLGVVAVAFFVTSAIGWCPAYLPFALTTRKGSGPSTPSRSA